MKNSPDVAIIGAGMAGLVAAKELEAAGLKTVILESRERVGGRIATAKQGEFMHERGAEMVYGDEAAAFVSQYTSVEPVESDDEPMQTYVFNGANLQTETEAGDDRAMETLQQWMRSLSPEDQDRIDLETALRLQDMSPDHFNRLHALLQAEYGVEPHKMSVAGALEGSTYNREAFYCPDGFSSFPKALADGVDVRFDEVVMRVKQSDTGVELFTGNGSVQAKQAIVTMPVAVLQQERHLFNPALSMHTQAAIRNIGLGVTAKVACVFNKQLWPNDMAELHTGKSAAPIVYPVPEYGNSPTLMVYVGGYQARRDKHDIRRNAMHSLSTIFDEIGAIKSADVISWKDSPGSFMSYSFLRPGGHWARKQLMQPEGRVRFAGEAYTDSEDAGTVGGAIQSGLHAARGIIDEM